MLLAVVIMMKKVTVVNQHKNCYKAYGMMAYTDDCPYFIVEKGYCYFANQPSTVYYVEKYKYTFDSKNNTLMCYGYDEESDTYDNEPWYIRVKSVSDTKLIIKLLNDDNQTVDDTRDCVKQ